MRLNTTKNQPFLSLFVAALVNPHDSGRAKSIACKGRRRGIAIRRPQQEAFILLLAMVLIAVLGGAVLATQLMIQQRLHAVSHRAQRYQRGLVADAAIKQVVAMNRFGVSSITQAVVRVDFSRASRVAMDWQLAPQSNLSAPDSWWIKATVTGDGSKDTRDYKVWRDGKFWRMERW